MSTQAVDVPRANHPCVRHVPPIMYCYPTIGTMACCRSSDRPPSVDVRSPTRHAIAGSLPCATQFWRLSARYRRTSLTAFGGLIRGALVESATLVLPIAYHQRRSPTPFPRCGEWLGVSRCRAEYISVSPARGARNGKRHVPRFVKSGWYGVVRDPHRPRAWQFPLLLAGICSAAICGILLDLAGLVGP